MINIVTLVKFAADYSPFLGIEKGAVLQEARVFNDPQLDARRCSQVFLLFICLSNSVFIFYIYFFFKKIICRLIFSLSGYHEASVSSEPGRNFY